LGDLNARIHTRLPGEESCFGEFVVPGVRTDWELGSNRELLLEACLSQDLVVANTFFNHGLRELVAFRRPGAPPLADIEAGKFAQLGYVLASAYWLSKILGVSSARAEALASHHFLLEASLDVSIEEKRRVRGININWTERAWMTITSRSVLCLRLNSRSQMTRRIVQAQAIAMTLVSTSRRRSGKRSASSPRCQFSPGGLGLFKGPWIGFQSGLTRARLATTRRRSALIRQSGIQRRQTGGIGCRA
jgi:hypothetical protein